LCSDFSLNACARESHWGEAGCPALDAPTSGISVEKIAENLSGPKPVPNEAMHNLRTDRSTTTRLLNSDQPVDSDIDKYLRDLPIPKCPPCAMPLALLPSIEFAQQQTLRYLS